MKTKFFYGMTALATLGLAACSADELAPSAPGQVAEADMTRYISVNISSPSIGGTRADEPGFNEGELGTDKDGNSEYFESVVKDAYFVFYDENDKVVGDIVNVTDLTFESLKSDPTASEHSNANKVIGVNILKGQNLPKKVLVYLNPQTQSGILNPLNVIETLTRNDVKKTGGNKTDKNPEGWLFSMSNSVYFDENSADADPSKKGKLCNIAEIPVNGLFDTEKDAIRELNKALGKEYTDENGNKVTPTAPDENAAKKVTTIYVERYAAKVQFKWLPNADNSGNNNPVYGGESEDDENIVKTYTYKDENGVTTVTSQTVKLTFEPDKWDVNAESNEMFVIKTFRSSDALGGYTMTNLTYDEAMGTNPNYLLGVNSASGNWVWNKQSLHRSFWGCSPSYYSITYPEVSSDYFNEATNEVNKEMKLKYLTWNELKEDGHDVKITPNVDYVKETTVGNLGLHNANNKYASIPSIIVTGTYKLSYGATGSENKIDEPTTFYLYGTGADSGKGVFFEAAIKDGLQTLESAVKDKDDNTVGSSLLYRLATRQNIVRMKETVTTDGKATTAVRNLTKDEMAKIFKIDRPTQDVLNVGAAEVGKDVKLAARKFTVQLTSTLTFADKTSEDGASTTSYELVYNDGTGDHPVVVAENSDVILNKVNNMLLRNVGYADKYKNGMAYYNIPIKHYGWYRTGNDNNRRDPNTNKMVEIDWSKTRVGDFGVVRNHLYNIEISKVDGLATAISSETTPIIPPQETDKHYVAYRLYILNWAVVPTQTEEL